MSTPSRDNRVNSRMKAKRKTLSHIGTMVNGQIIDIPFDTSYYTECKLYSHAKNGLYYVKKYNIPLEGDKNSDKKNTPFLISTSKNFKPTIAFVASLDKEHLKKSKDVVSAMNWKGSNILGKAGIGWIAYRLCAKKTNNYMRTADGTNTGVGVTAKRCGLATSLSYLCYRDIFVQRPGIEYDFEEDHIGNTEKDREFLDFTRDLCKNIIGPLYIVTDILAGSRAYIYAASDACFQILVAYDRTEDCGHHPYVISELIEEFEKRPPKPPRKGHVTDPVLKKVAGDAGLRWYFCRPYDKYWKIMCG